MKNYFKDKRGSALALIIIAMVVLAVLGIALLRTSLVEKRIAIREESRVKAYYIARSGAEVASSWIEDPSHKLDTIQELIEENQNNTDSPTDFEGGQFWVSFSGDGFTPTIHSRGEYAGVSQEVSVALQKNYLFDSAVTVADNLHMQNKNNSHVYGDVALAPGATITGNGDENIGGLHQIDTVFPSPTDPNLPVSEESWPPLDNTVTNGDGYAGHRFGSVTFSNDKYYFILTGNMAIQFDELNVRSNTEIYVSGTGVLSIYASEVDFKGRLFTTDSTVSTVLNIFDEGNFDMQTGNGTFEGFIYGPNADMTVKANFESVGAIIARKLEIQAGGSVYFDSDLGNIYPEDIGLPSLGYSKTVWSD